MQGARGGDSLDGFYASEVVETSETLRSVSVRVVGGSEALLWSIDVRIDAIALLRHAQLLHLAREPQSRPLLLQAHIHIFTFSHFYI